MLYSREDNSPHFEDKTRQTPAWKKFSPYAIIHLVLQTCDIGEQSRLKIHVACSDCYQVLVASDIKFHPLD